MGAARLLNQYGPIEAFPAAVLGEQLEEALLFKRLATLRTDAKLFGDVEALRWRGPRRAFGKWAARIEAPQLLQRASEVQTRVEAR